MSSTSIKLGIQLKIFSFVIIASLKLQDLNYEFAQKLYILQVKSVLIPS